MLSRSTVTELCAFCVASLVLTISLALAQGAAPPSVAQQVLENRTIAGIVIRGNVRVPESTIRQFIKSAEGQPFSEDKARADYQALLSSGLFTDVRLLTEIREPGKVVLIFEVTEPAVIQQVDFAGLQSVQTSELLEHLRKTNLTLQPGARIDENKLARTVRALEQYLQIRGFPLARVTISRTPVGPNAFNLKFTIEEGPRARIGHIEFEGNSVFSDEELRQSLELTSESSFWSRLRGRDLYLKERLDYDLRSNVLARYHSKGYIFAKIEEPRVELIETEGGIPGLQRRRLEYRITVPIVEGEQFRYSGFRVEGVERVEKEKVTDKYEAAAGKIVDFVSLGQANEKVKKLYSERGFLDMELIPEMRPDFDKRLVDLTIRIHEGGRYLVDEINFIGNERTRDKVLRRELVLQERDPFNGTLLDLSLQRLSRLNFIEPVTDRDHQLVKDRTNEEVDIVVRIHERDPHAINLTGGLGGISGSYIGIQYLSRNFRGLGQTLEAQVETGSRTSNYVLGWSDPYWLDTNLTLGLHAFHRRLRYGSLGFLPGETAAEFGLFTQQSTGFQVVASYPSTAFSRFGVSYSFDTNKVYDIRDDFRSFAIAQLVLLTTGGTIDEALTGILRSQLTPFWRYDTRDRLFGATRGSYLTLQMPIAGGPLGGRINLGHPFIEYQRFQPDPLTKGRNTWAFRARAQHVFAFGTLPDGTPKPVPFLERIYYGGEYNLRGFDVRSVGPIAIHETMAVDPDGNPIPDPSTGMPMVNRQAVAMGGDTGTVLTAEYRIPIIGPLQLTPFLDAGTSTVIRKKDLRLSTGADANALLIEATNNVWRMSTGVEIQFLVPVVNQPFRVILAYNPLRLDTTAEVAGQTLVFEEPRTNVKFSIGYSF
ncbi:MAG TPA: outer membrane protein assembly factor BamA [Acidobacteriota bacterium]|nr:outer membrane protein assembly factor BamA [Acidobacteriota bacterium]